MVTCFLAICAEVRKESERELPESVWPEGQVGEASAHSSAGKACQSHPESTNHHVSIKQSLFPLFHYVSINNPPFSPRGH